MSIGWLSSIRIQIASHLSFIHLTTPSECALPILFCLSPSLSSAHTSLWICLQFAIRICWGRAPTFTKSFIYIYRKYFTCQRFVCTLWANRTAFHHLNSDSSCENTQNNYMSIHKQMHLNWLRQKPEMNVPTWNMERQRNERTGENKMLH